MLRWWLVPGVLAGALACGGSPVPEAVSPRDAGARGAALAKVAVENRTDRRLAIAFRPAASRGTEVVVGRVEPGATARLAPVPAEEPILLLASDPRGATLSLSPRTFDTDDEWLWVIEADSRFVEADAGGGGR
ncbi:MAG: hypothetical protein ACODAE_11585 [Gemmatimonadota bacterium]